MFNFTPKDLSAQNFQNLIDSINYYQKQSKFDVSLEWCEKALVKCVEGSGKLDTNYTNIISIMIRNNYSLGNYQLALELSSMEYLDLLSLLHGEGHVAYIEATMYKGNIYNQLGKLDSARSLLIKADSLFIKYKIPENLELAENFLYLAYSYKDYDQFNNAEILFKKAILIMKKLYDGDNINLAIAIHYQATFYKRFGKLKLAEEKNLLCYEMLKRLNLKDDPGYAQIYSNIASMYFEVKKFKRSEFFYLEALKIYKNIYKEENLAFASLYTNLGNLYSELDQGDAEQYYTRAIEIYDSIYKNQYTYSYVKAIQYYGVYCNRIGNYHKAKELLNTSEKILELMFPDDHQEKMTLYTNSGSNYTDLGKYEISLEYYEKAYRMGLRLYDNNHPQVYANTINLATLYIKLEKYLLAEKYFNECLKICEILYQDNEYFLAILYGQISNLFKFKGDYYSSLHYAELAADIFRKLNLQQNINFAVSLSNLSSLYRQFRQYQKSIECDLIAKQIYDSKKIANNNYLILLLSLSSSYVSIGDYEKSENSLFEAVEIFKEIHEETDHPLLASIYENIGMMYYTNDEYKKAKIYLHKSLEMKKKVYNSNSREFAYIYQALGLLYSKLGDFQFADLYFDKVLDNTKWVMRNYFFKLPENDKLMFYNQLMETYNLYNYYASSRASQKPEYISSIFNNSLNLKNILFESNLFLQKTLENSNDSLNTSLLTTWEMLRNKISRNFKKTKNELKSDQINLDSLFKLSMSIEKKLIEHNKINKHYSTKMNLSWKDVQERLKPNEALVEIVKINHINLHYKTDTIFYVALILHKEIKNNPEMVFLGSSIDLDSLYLKHISTMDIAQNKTSDQVPNINEIFYSCIWSKISEKIGTTSTIYISSDGILNKINFNALQNPKTGKFLIEEKEIRIISSSRSLINNNTIQSNHESICLIGAPDYSTKNDSIDQSLSGNFITRSINQAPLEDSLLRNIFSSPLPNSKIELEKISTIFEEKEWSIVKLMNVNASEKNLKRIKNPKILHIATHGKFLNKREAEYLHRSGIMSNHYIYNPLFRSYITLAGANIPQQVYDGDDGYLTAYEAMDLNLDSTELVVLSACETGLGEIKNSEGVYGLQRAFFYAGAKKIIMSLWKVYDKPTREFMVKFYENYLSGMTMRKAFREAQLYMKEQYPNPFIWGSFVMVDG